MKYKILRLPIAGFTTNKFPEKQSIWPGRLLECHILTAPINADFKWHVAAPSRDNPEDIRWVIQMQTVRNHFFNCFNRHVLSYFCEKYPEFSSVIHRGSLNASTHQQLGCFILTQWRCSIEPRGSCGVDETGKTLLFILLLVDGFKSDKHCLISATSNWRECSVDSISHSILLSFCFSSLGLLVSSHFGTGNCLRKVYKQRSHIHRRLSLSVHRCRSYTFNFVQLKWYSVSQQPSHLIRSSIPPMGNVHLPHLERLIMVLLKRYNLSLCYVINELFLGCFGSS